MLAKYKSAGSKIYCDQFRKVYNKYIEILTYIYTCFNLYWFGLTCYKVIVFSGDGNGRKVHDCDGAVLKLKFTNYIFIPLREELKETANYPHFVDKGGGGFLKCG